MVVGRRVLIAMTCVGSATGCLLGDHFFNLNGSVVACGTTSPIMGVAIAANIDKGATPGPYPTPYMTGATGQFTVHIADYPDDWVTLTFTKPGFSTLSQQFKGSTQRADVCMTPSP